MFSPRCSLLHIVGWSWFLMSTFVIFTLLCIGDTRNILYPNAPTSLLLNATSCQTLKTRVLTCYKVVSHMPTLRFHMFPLLREPPIASNEVLGVYPGAFVYCSQEVKNSVSLRCFVGIFRSMFVSWSNMALCECNDPDTNQHAVFLRIDTPHPARMAHKAIKQNARAHSHPRSSMSPTNRLALRRVSFCLPNFSVLACKRSL